MKEALHYTEKNDKSLECNLCPHNCWINDGQRGLCRVRENRGGKLYSMVYGKPCAVNVDPIEKKPLYHFLPGSRVYSIGTNGCNMRCMHCQNWDISTTGENEKYCYNTTPDNVITETADSGCGIIAYTYNEPTVNYEFVLEVSRESSRRGIKNVMVTNGYISIDPLRELFQYIDAANVDLKGFDPAFYQKICGAKLEPVLQNLAELKKMGVWIEITNLVIPGHNDKPGGILKMCDWIKSNLGTELPLHFSAFYPAHEMKDVDPTSLDTLNTAQQIARDTGFSYVYLGNAGIPATTSCPECGKRVIDRKGHNIRNLLSKDGTCSCGTEIPGVWE